MATGLDCGIPCGDIVFVEFNWGVRIGIAPLISETAIHEACAHAILFHRLWTPRQLSISVWASEVSACVVLAYLLTCTYGV